MYLTLLPLVLGWVFILGRTLIFFLLHKIISIFIRPKTRFGKSVICWKLGSFSQFDCLLTGQYLLFYAILSQFRQ